MRREVLFVSLSFARAKACACLGVTPWWIAAAALAPERRRLHQDGERPMPRQPARVACARSTCTPQRAHSFHTGTTRRRGLSRTPSVQEYMIHRLPSTCGWAKGYRQRGAVANHGFLRCRNKTHTRGIIAHVNPTAPHRTRCDKACHHKGYDSSLNVGAPRFPLLQTSTA